MKSLIGIALALSSSFTFATEQCNNLLDFETKKLHSKETINFCEAYKGKVLLAVNTASECGFTPQFKSLEALYKKYKDQGLEIVGFPSNDFFQEHKDESETADVCYKNFGVSFTMVAPSNVRGDKANPFFQQLATNSERWVKWNFFKYLVDENGKVVGSWNSKEDPLGGNLEETIKAVLKVNNS